jgi:hypothetical protein
MAENTDSSASNPAGNETPLRFIQNSLRSGHSLSTRCTGGGVWGILMSCRIFARA